MFTILFYFGNNYGIKSTCPRFGDIETNPNPKSNIVQKLNIYY